MKYYTKERSEIYARNAERQRKERELAMTDNDIRVYVFTYTIGDMKNTGMWRARSLATAVRQITEQWDAIYIIAVSLLPRDREREVADQCKAHHSITGGTDR